jgi:hypothetical protein
MQLVNDRYTQNVFFFYTVKYSPYRRTFEIRAIGLNVILSYGQNVCTHKASFLENSVFSS